MFLLKNLALSCALLLLASSSLTLSAQPPEEAARLAADAEQHLAKVTAAADKLIDALRKGHGSSAHKLAKLALIRTFIDGSLAPAIDIDLNRALSDLEHMSSNYKLPEEVDKELRSLLSELAFQKRYAEVFIVQARARRTLAYRYLGSFAKNPRHPSGLAALRNAIALFTLNEQHPEDYPKFRAKRDLKALCLSLLTGRPSLFVNEDLPTDIEEGLALLRFLLAKDLVSIGSIYDLAQQTLRLPYYELARAILLTQGFVRKPQKQNAEEEASQAGLRLLEAYQEGLRLLETLRNNEQLPTARVYHSLLTLRDLNTDRDAQERAFEQLHGSVAGAGNSEGAADYGLFLEDRKPGEGESFLEGLVRTGHPEAAINLARLQMVDPRFRRGNRAEEADFRESTMQLLLPIANIEGIEGLTHPELAQGRVERARGLLAKLALRRAYAGAAFVPPSIFQRAPALLSTLLLLALQQNSR